MTHRLVLALVGATVTFSPGVSPATDVRSRGAIILSVTNLEDATGTLHCALFDRSDGFPGEPKKARARVRSKPIDGRGECRFEGVQAGRYAVALWHDVDDDGQLDSNFLGIPQEPVGATNNATGSFGPPSFDDAAFTFEPPTFRQAVRLN